MQIDLKNIDHTNFMVHPHNVAGETVWLIQPIHIGAKFTKETMIFRSSVWNSNGDLVSAGFRKFWNNGEQPDLYPNPEKHIKDWAAIEKIDGSLLCVSKYKGQLIVRTRGTVDATKLELNGDEIELLKNKYPKFFDFGTVETADYSLIGEWVSPRNQIVLRYNELDLYLIGKVYHENYTLALQTELNELAKEFGMKRPQIFTFRSMIEIVETVKEFKDKEGVCLYFNKGQNIVKIKGDWYLTLHHLKSELSSQEKVLDLYLQQNQPSYTDFYNYIVGLFDFELAEYIRPNVSMIVDAKKEVDKIVDHMKNFVEPLKSLARKDAALKIMEAYGKTNRSGFAFRLLDSRSFENEMYKKLYFQVLKK